MLKISSPVGARWYVPLSEKEKDRPCRFKIRPLTGEELENALYKHEFSKSGGLMIHPDGIKSALSNGILDWENVCDDRGEVTFSRLSIRLLPYEIRAELASEIINMSFMSEEEEKNS